MTTDQRVTILESRLADLRISEADLRSQIRQARLDHWQGRIDDLELQVRLGAVEGSDRLDQARTTLTTTWGKARAEMLETSSDAAHAAQAVQASLHGAYDDVRAALIDAKNAVSR